MAIDLDLSDIDLLSEHSTPPGNENPFDDLLGNHETRCDLFDGPNDQLWEMDGAIGELAATIDLHEKTILDQLETIADQAKMIQSLTEDLSIYFYCPTLT